MRNGIFTCALIIVFALEIAVLIWFAFHGTEYKQDTVEVNEAVQSVREDWHKIAAHVNETALDYVCLLYTSPSPRDGATSRMPSSA